jgi:hypothetical protein
MRWRNAALSGVGGESMKWYWVLLISWCAFMAGYFIAAFMAAAGRGEKDE